MGCRLVGYGVNDALKRRFRAFWLATVVGTAFSWGAFFALISLTTPMYRLWIALVSAVLGGAIAGCTSGAAKSPASFVIGSGLAVQLYDPALGFGGFPQTDAHVSTLLALVIAAYFGLTFPFTLLSSRNVRGTPGSRIVKALKP